MEYYKDLNMQGIYKKISDVIGRILPEMKENISPDKDLIKDLGADSLSLIDIIMNAEDAFGIEIADSEIEKAKTVGDCVNLAYDKIYKKK